MFWADEIANKLDKKKKQLVDDAWSASGFAHVGSLRGVIIHDIANRTLIKDGLDTRYTFIMDDIDPMDGMPGYLDANVYNQEMGKPLCDIPAPDKKFGSLARYFGEDFIETSKLAGSQPEFLWNSEIYKSGKYNEVIKIALDKAQEISNIYRKYNGVEKGEQWYPFQPICEKCGKIGTTTVTSWDGENISYVCEESKVEWAKGCGYEGKQSPYDGKGKLYWRVEWPARWKALCITVEGEGKDHWSAGGSRDLADILIKDIFNYRSPIDIRYDWLYIGGKKMSSSKGIGVTAKEMATLLPNEVLRFLMAKNPRKTIDFDPEGVTIPNLFDDYDRAMKAFQKEIDFPDLGRAYEIVQEKGFEPGYRMRFSKVALAIQMPKIDIHKEAENEKGSKLTKSELANLDERIIYAQKWLDKYAPADYVFKVLDKEPTITLSKVQKDFLTKLIEIFKTKKDWKGEELHSELHEVKKSMEISPKDAFSAIYLSFLGKESGPQAGWLLASLDHDFVATRLYNMSRSK